VQNKQMLAGYMFVERAWAEFCAVRAVKDFKPTKAINLFGDVIFKDLGVDSELSNATMQDEAFANSVKTRGRIITIPRVTFINDDLGAFGQIPMLMGRGAGLKLNELVYTLLMNPGKDVPGGATNFFAATHTVPNALGNSNYLTGASSALSSSGLQQATLLVDNQVDPKGFPLGMDAEILLYPPDLEQTAWELLVSNAIIMANLGSTSSAKVQPSDNRWKNRYKPVKSRYLNKTSLSGNTVLGSTTAWFLFMNPSILPAIEVAFLNGNEMPVVQQAGPDFQFNIMGMSTRAFFDTDVNMQNYRGSIRSDGA
jgi:hypothetical protein